MQKQLSTILLVLALIFSINGLSAKESRPLLLPLTVQTGGPVLTVSQTSPSSALMSWTPFGLGQYTITVYDLTTFQCVTTFSTSNTSAAISGLQTGHNYRFITADKFENLIIIDLVLA